MISVLHLSSRMMQPICLKIIEDRTDIRSMIITSQLPVKKWYDYLNNNTIADAILDRIVYSSHRIEMEGESMRKRNQI